LFGKGENVFRNYESKATGTAAKKNNTVICTGGGIIKRKENMTALANSGTIVFIDRPLDSILDDIDHDTRPLLDGKKESVIKLYDERIDLYRRYAHETVKNDQSFKHVLDQLEMIWEGKKI